MHNFLKSVLRASILPLISHCLKANHTDKLNLCARHSTKFISFFQASHKIGIILLIVYTSRLKNHIEIVLSKIMQDCGLNVSPKFGNVVP